MTEMTLDSPCISICKLDAQNIYCIGCHRNRDEIGEWAFASDTRKKEIIENALRRAAATSS